MADRTDRSPASNASQILRRRAQLLHPASARCMINPWRVTTPPQQLSHWSEPACATLGIEESR